MEEGFFFFLQSRQWARVQSPRWHVQVGSWRTRVVFWTIGARDK
jgi:hypothetical protein